MTAAEALHHARTAPLASLGVITGNASILVLAPHPDDESLGCGGLIAACAAAGIRVDVVLLTDGEGSHPGYPPASLAKLRVRETTAALHELGGSEATLHRLGCRDQHAPAAGPLFEAAVERLVALLRQTGAATLFAAWSNDPHCDHEAGAAIAAEAARRTGCRHLAYPVWGWTLPDDTKVSAGLALRLDVSAHLPAKRRAVACHRSQHGGAVGDTQGFVLPAALLNACLTPTESFFDQTSVPAPAVQ